MFRTFNPLLGKWEAYICLGGGPGPEILQVFCGPFPDIPSPGTEHLIDYGVLFCFVFFIFYFTLQYRICFAIH